MPQPRDWPSRTVSGKAYDLISGEGRRVWDACLERAARTAAPVAALPLIADDGAGGAAVDAVAEPVARYGAPRPVAPRLGQGTFRIAVTEAYGRACAVTGEHSLPVLEAAHIRSYSQAGPHDVANGVLLRADLHRLFDQGYVTVTPELRLEVSGRLREDYRNGRSYYPLHGSALRLPTAARERPAAEFLRWHNEDVYLG